MLRALLIRAAVPVFVFFAAQQELTCAAEDNQKSSAKAPAAIGVWDTGQASAEPLTPKTLITPDGWTALAAGGKAAAFKGDAVLSNGRIIAVARQRSSVVEVYSVGTEGPVARLRLHLLT